MPTVHLAERTHLRAERVLAAARDFSEHRAELWPDVHLEHFTVHELGDTHAEVTEGNPWPIGLVWERLRYDWSTPGAVKGVVLESNLFHPGSTWQLHATRTSDGTQVEVLADRRLRAPRGWLLWPLFPLGLVRASVAQDLRHFLDVVERDANAA